MNTPATPENRPDEAAQETTDEEKKRALQEFVDTANLRDPRLTAAVVELERLKALPSKAVKRELKLLDEEMAKLEAIKAAAQNYMELQSANKKQDKLKAERDKLLGLGKPKKAAPRAIRKGRGEREIVFRCVADIEEKPIQWFWPDCIARGTYNLLAGDADNGKSQITFAIAKIVTNGLVWPVCGSPCPVGAVIFISSEEHAEYILRPRLKAAGVNMDFCFILENVKYKDADGELKDDGFKIGTDLYLLGDLVEFIREKTGVAVSLIVIDPITSYVGGIRSSENTSVRSILTPLARFAEQHNVAILGVSHFNKSNSQDANQRVTGSTAFYEVARSVWQVYSDENNLDRRMMLPSKNNLSKNRLGFGITFKSIPLATGGETSTIEFEDKYETRRANDVMRANQKANMEDRGSQLKEAKQFLTKLLKNGPVKSSEVKEKYLAEGIHKKTIERAKTDLGIKHYRVVEDGLDAFFWTLEKEKNTPPYEKHGEHDERTDNQQVRNDKNAISGYVRQTNILKGDQKIYLATIAEIESKL